MPALTRILAILAATYTANCAFAQAPSASKEQKIILPTANDHLFTGQNEKFYMYVYRKFEGQESRPWSGGKYGFVRNMRRTEDGLIGTRFHEGIDIKPLKRDNSNNPLDEIMAIAAGTVVYTNTSSSRSNYGKYIVIEHSWSCGPVYSLYAHLSKISVKKGETIQQGQSIGQMGYTGAGLNKDRSHLHLELNLLLSERFTQWHDKHLGGTNYHGIHNGMNMSGLDIGAYYIMQKRDPSLTLPRFIKSRPIYYKVTVPRATGANVMPILKRYPWLAQGLEKNPSPSWEIAFTASGFPVSIIPSRRQVSAPRITSVRKCRSKHSYHTKGFLVGTGYRASLSDSGKRFIQLVTDTFAAEENTRGQ